MSRKISLRQKYNNLRIRYLKLQSRYFRLKAKRLKGIEPSSHEEEAVSRKTYLELLAKLRRCQAKVTELHQRLAEK